MAKSETVVNHEQLTVSMSRVFDAPRELVWQVYTDPTLVPSWWGPRNLTTVVDKMDVREGGEWRYVQRAENGHEYGFNGVYKEVSPPQRLTYTFEFEPMAGHVITDAVTFEAIAQDKTRVTVLSQFDNLEDLEGMLKSGMEGGANESWDRVEELLAEMQLQQR